MKIVTKYKCEICGKVHDTEARCRRCEESHVRPDHIVHCNYTSSEYPDRISIVMQDGHVGRYVWIDNECYE